MVVRPPTGGHYLQHRFVWLLLSDLLYELLPFFFTPNQVFVEHNMANATSWFQTNIKKSCHSRERNLASPSSPGLTDMTYGPLDGQTHLQRCVDSSKKTIIFEAYQVVVFIDGFGRLVVGHV